MLLLCHCVMQHMFALEAWTARTSDTNHLLPFCPCAYREGLIELTPDSAAFLAFSASFSSANCWFSFSCSACSRACSLASSSFSRLCCSSYVARTEADQAEYTVACVSCSFQRMIQKTFLKCKSIWVPGLCTLHSFITPESLTWSGNTWHLDSPLFLNLSFQFILQLGGLLLLGSNLLWPHVDLITPEIDLHVSSTIVIIWLSSAVMPLCSPASLLALLDSSAACKAEPV